MFQGWIFRSLASTLAASFFLSVGLAVFTSSMARRCVAEALADSAAEDTFAAMLADHAAQERKFEDAIEEAKTEDETKLAWNLRPDVLIFSRRALKIAEAKPKDLAARDALLWVVVQQHSGIPRGDRSEIEERAVQLLLEHHANDPEVPRVALLLNNLPWLNRERFMQGLVDRATDRETKGLARLALARYLMKKIESAEAVQAPDAPAKSSNPEYAETFADLRACDVAATRSKTEQLLDEVITQYGDIPFVRGGHAREMDVQRGKKLASVGTTLQDEIRNFVVGKPAPDIDGKDLEGAPLKLSSFRGKVVVLVFWASWCGPCMAEVPHELELIERHKNDRFALLGVTADEDPAAAREAIKTNHIRWPNWQDPLTAKGEGPIAERYHVHYLPGVFVLDADGILRAKNARGEKLDKIVEKLLTEQKSCQ